MKKEANSEKREPCQREIVTKVGAGWPYVGKGREECEPY